MSRVRALYDTWSPTFVACAGTTHQTVLLPVGPTPTATNLELAKRAGVAAGEHWLDAGCGAGGPAGDIASAHNGLLVDAVTLSPVQQGLASAELARRGLADRVAVHCADYHDLPFADAAFDGAWLFESACYSPDPARLLAELRRVVRRGGRVYVKDLFRKPRVASAAAQRDLLLLQELWALPTPATLAQWQKLARTAGFAVVRAAPLEGATAYWYTGTMFELGPAGLRRNAFGEHFAVNMPAVPVVWAELLLQAA
ncbi:MAG: methyltransferase domain-containing protein [Deltaproteobacteria bacterium]|nr:methyltransferase domain-containing protein [Deltaproteobacteria bacterium]